jgi:predicted RNA-binding Zn-ribbon protein involved in translation (DUF1610 family)
MAISVQCPACQKLLKAEEESAGKRIKCPSCGEVLAVPVAATVSAPAPAEEGGERRPCPMCGEEIAAAARKCRFCGEVFDPGLRRTASGGPRMARQDLYRVAVSQKVILWCILAYLIVVVAQFAVPPESRLLLGLAFLPVALVATVFVFRLALKVYGTGMGVFLGIMTLIPFIGLITLIIINQKATGLLNQRGYRVGLLGADLSQFHREL